ncbi:MAG: hypothetical protein AAGE89_12590 [Pseudomonadota bacterium]
MIEFPRGNLKDGETVITLMERADRSTFLHESGHFFLEVFQDIAGSGGAPTDIQADMAAIHDFLGSRPGEGFTVAQQEKWARSFETYLMEGKAPSSRLATAFRRFKEWLTEIYRTAVNLKAPITPEIRDVMDRMLATEAEINAAREDAGMAPLFGETSPTTMSAQDKRRYATLVDRAKGQAEDALRSKSMHAIRPGERKTNQTERHDEMLADESLGEHARLAAHSKAQGELVIMEAQHLARLAGQPDTSLSETAFETQAKGMIAILPVRDVLRDETFVLAECLESTPV